MYCRALCWIAFLVLACVPSLAAEATAEKGEAKKEQEKPPVMVELAEGKLLLPAPGEWKRVKPRNRLLEVEFNIPAKEAEGAAARFTVMASGGTIRQNVDRWIGQFRNHKAPENGQVGQVTRHEIDGMIAHCVDLTGDFQDSPRGPFGPKVERKGYRMLGAILETKESGNYFFKLVGPEKLVQENAKAYLEMLKGIEQN